LENINISIKKRADELKKKEKLKKQKDLEQFDNTEILWERPIINKYKKEEKIKNKKTLPSEDFNSLKKVKSKNN
jgi:DNA/RNA-binding domain of Phe-tRNA-synthetase-like protein